MVQMVFLSAVNFFRWVVLFTCHHDRYHLPPRGYSNPLAAGVFWLFRDKQPPVGLVVLKAYSEKKTSNDRIVWVCQPH